MPRTRRPCWPPCGPISNEDGITLAYEAPTALAGAGRSSAPPTASLDRVVGPHHRRLDAGRRRRPALRRLQQEMQMLLYTLPLNDAAAQGGCCR
jgi:hypothetical protein